MKVLSLLTASFFVLLLTACNKEPPPVPPRPDPCPWPEVTTQGLNTFGCKINGKEWVPCINPWLLLTITRPIDCTVRESDGSNFLSLVLNRVIKDSTYSDATLDGGIIIGLKPCSVGKMNINSDFEFASMHVFADWEGCSYEAFDSQAENSLMITRLDTSKNIISGQFQMTLIDEQSGKQISITDGRFDINYYPQ